MFGDTSNAESVSDVNDFGPSSFVQKVADYGCLTPVRDEVGPLSYTFSLVICHNAFFRVFAQHLQHIDFCIYFCNRLRPQILQHTTAVKVRVARIWLLNLTVYCNKLLKWCRNQLLISGILRQMEDPIAQVSSIRFDN
jgi:hypothetical protein